MTRLTRAWGALEPEQRIAAAAALALLVTMFLPWYELQSVNRRTNVIYSHSISAFGDVSFVEAAVFLVAAGVLALLFARAERRDFHMPGSDGAVVMAAGGWATLLIFYRVFSRPDGHGYPVGIQWGFFLAFVASGLLTYAGWRMRALAEPEPPLVRRSTRGRPPSSEPDDDLTAVIPATPLPERPAPVPARADQPRAQPLPQDSTRAPAGGDQPPAPRHPARALPRADQPAAQRPPAPATQAARRRPRHPPAPAQQLSLEEQPTEPERH
jgi:hypothetical protein